MSATCQTTAASSVAPKKRCTSPAPWKPPNSAREHRGPRRVAEQQRQPGRGQAEERHHDDDVQQPRRPIEPRECARRRGDRRGARRLTGMRGVDHERPSSCRLAAARPAATARTTAGCGGRRTRSSRGSAPSRSGSPTRARRCARSRAGSDAGRTARSSRSRPGGTCRTSSAGCAGDTVDAGFDAGRMSCAPWQSAHAATRAKPSWVTLPWNVRRERLDDRARGTCRTPAVDAQPPRVGVGPLDRVRGVAVGADRRARVALLQRRGVDAGVVAALDAVVAGRRSPAPARASTRLVGSALPRMSCVPWQSAQAGATVEARLLPRPRVNAVVILRADRRRDSWRSRPSSACRDGETR